MRRAESKSTPVELEEDIEFSSVTSLRESFLKTVETLREDPAKRYVITKHGQPQAVLMSYQTYSLLRKVMDQTLARTVAASSSDPIGSTMTKPPLLSMRPCTRTPLRPQFQPRCKAFARRSIKWKQCWVRRVSAKKIEKRSNPAVFSNHITF
jgi:prevent-host-death family protein